MILEVPRRRAKMRDMSHTLTRERCLFYERRYAMLMRSAATQRASRCACLFAVVYVYRHAVCFTFVC